MRDEDIEGALAFLEAAGRLKDTLRSAHTGAGRRESTAEHTWRLCLMALVFEDGCGGVDLLRLLKVCLVHDLGEAIGGDVPAVLQREGDGRAARERADLADLASPLAPALRAELLALWDEYDAGATKEAVLAKGFDKLETILQHNQGANPEGFDYGFNLEYGRERTDAHPMLRAIRAVLDEGTKARMGA
ncbi:MAG: HD domain-containing protein [Geminicoccaceae bacterium]|nr:HD domain-containing protein [Geminicoccaceae bacterium]